MRTLIIIASLLALTQPMYGRRADSDTDATDSCGRVLAVALASIQDATLGNESTVSFDLVTRRKDGTEFVDTMRLYRQGSHRLTISSGATVVEDGSAIVYIANDQSLIFIRDQDPRRDSMPTALLELVKIVRQGSAVTCTREDSGYTRYTVTLEHSSLDVSVSQIRFVTDGSGSVVEVETVYSGDGGTSSILMRNIQTSDRARHPLLDSTALGVVLEEGKLKSDYRTFTLKDIRSVSQ